MSNRTDKGFQEEYRFLSNFWFFEKPMQYGEVSFPTVEHFFVAMKTKDNGDRVKISKMPLKGIKAYGRNLSLREDWEDIKEDVMEYALRYKFSQHNPGLLKQLQATEGTELIEFNYWNDKIWGVCLKTGEGDNKLGKLLMKIRKESKPKLYYTGVGSRETPPKVLETMRQLGKVLAEKGYVLRSGGAGGADTAFEQGCDDFTKDDKVGMKEIFIPWKGFSGRHRHEQDVYCLDENLYRNNCFDIAKKYHPGWHRVSQGGRSLHSRNVLQVLGQNIQTPTAFVVAYAKRDKNGKAKGGTAMAINIAEDNKIPVFNLYDVPEDWKLQEILNWIGIH